MENIPNKKQFPEFVYNLLIIATALLLWQITVVFLKVPNHLVPTPLRIFSKLLSGWPLLLKDIRVTSVEILLGFSACVLFSVSFSTLIIGAQVFERAFMPLLIFTQTIPLIAVVPILIIWLGIGILPKIIVVFLVSFFQLLILTTSGLKSVEPEMIDLMRSMSASNLDIFKKVRFPSALPYMFDGMKLAALLSVIGAVVAEIFGADFGLGHAIVYAINDLDTELLFVIIFILTGMGAALYYFIVYLEKVVLFWHVAMRKEQVVRDVG
jgi:NitT/TauT family transport system permease protein